MTKILVTHLSKLKAINWLMSSERPIKDPGRHRNIHTAWSVFVNQMKPILLKENPDITKRQLYIDLSDMWQHQNDRERSSCTTKAKYLMQKEHRQKNFRNRNKEDHQKKKISPYSIFVSEKQHEMKVLFPELTLSERSQQIAQLWKNLDQTEKDKYTNQAKRENRKLNKPSSDEDDCYEVSVHPKKSSEKNTEKALDFDSIFIDFNEEASLM